MACLYRLGLKSPIVVCSCTPPRISWSGLPAKPEGPANNNDDFYDTTTFTGGSGKEINGSRLNACTSGYCDISSPVAVGNAFHLYISNATSFIFALKSTIYTSMTTAFSFTLTQVC